MRNFLLAALAAVSFSSFAQVSIKVTPESPVVVQSQLHIGDTTITSPWFRYFVEVTNNSKETITIKGVHTNVIGIAGKVPTELARTIWFSEFDTDACKYHSFGTLTAGETRKLQLTGENPACTQYNPAMYIGGLFPLDDQTHIYDVEVRIFGWTGTIENPDKALEGIGAEFKTQ